MAVKMLKLRSRKEWLEKRKSYIGGSEASCIVGMNPYQTNVELWELKTGRREPKDLSENPFVEYGRNAEEYLRELFRLDFPQYEIDYKRLMELFKIVFPKSEVKYENLKELFKLDFPQYKVDYIENNIWLNDKYPFAHASLDGWLTDELGRFGVLEIKTTNILQNIQKEKWNERIPDNYYIQVLHYMMVTEADFAIVKAQLKDNYDGDTCLTTKHYTIERSKVEDDIEYLMEAEKKFSEHIINDTKPNLVLPMI